MKKDSGLFKKDRRIETRRQQADRRTFTRPSLLLRIRGTLIALLAISIIGALVIYYFK